MGILVRKGLLMIAEILALYALGAAGIFVGLRITPRAPWWRDALIAALWLPALLSGFTFEGPSEPGDEP